MAEKTPQPIVIGIVIDMKRRPGGKPATEVQYNSRTMGKKAAMFTVLCNFRLGSVNQLSRKFTLDEGHLVTSPQLKCYIEICASFKDI